MSFYERSEESPLPSKYYVIWKQKKVLKYLDNHGPIELLILKLMNHHLSNVG